MKKPANRLLLGPGPSNVPRSVLAAMSRPLVGHLDPLFLGLMNRVQDQLRALFRTSNRLTIPISGTGTAGMEASVANFVEPGDSVLVGINGVFGQRIAEMVRRHGGECTTVSVPFGEPLDGARLAQAAERCRPALVAVVHAETSTGVLQPIEPIREIADRFGALLLVDTVTSLGGHPVEVDAWGIDIAYSGTQKCLSCPPGLAPLTVSPRAVEKMKRRRAPCSSWYLDLELLCSYWGEDRAYHHTAPISMNYALEEALRLVLEEGLEARWQRHRENHQALAAGLDAMGLELIVPPEFRLWSLNTVRIPEGVEEARLRAQLLEEFNLEIGGGLGALKGKVWRVGLMGENSRPESVLYFLDCLRQCLASQGRECGEGAEAARDWYRSREVLLEESTSGS